VKVADGTKLIRKLRATLINRGFRTGTVEYTSGNYNEAGTLIQEKIPTVTSEIGECGVINGEFYLVIILKRSGLDEILLKKLRSLGEIKIYGFKNFEKNLTIQEVLSSQSKEKYIQMQYDGFKAADSASFLELHKKLKFLLFRHKSSLVNQLDTAL